MKRFVGSMILCVLVTPAFADQHEKPADSGGEMPAMSAEDQAMMEAYMKAGTPGEPHARMAEEAGKWKATMKSWMGPGEPMVSHGVATRQMILDGRVLEERFDATVMGRPFQGFGLTGYDNTTGEYWSTWNDSWSTGVMVTHGQWNDELQAYVYMGEYADPMSGDAVPVKMTVSSPSPGVENLEMWEMHGGEMAKTMEIHLVKE